MLSTLREPLDAARLIDNILQQPVLCREIFRSLRSGEVSVFLCTVRSSQRAMPHRPWKTRTRRFGNTSVRSMRPVDTNVLVRLLARDDLDQVKPAESFIAPGAWVSHLVLAEALWALEAVYDRTAEQIALAVDRLLNHKELTIQDAEVVTDALTHFKKRPALGFSDCLVLELARKAGQPASGHVRSQSFKARRCKASRMSRQRTDAGRACDPDAAACGVDDSGSSRPPGCLPAVSCQSPWQCAANSSQVGIPRRVRFADPMIYKRRRDAESEAELCELVALSQDMKLDT
jgi:predicted nucleic-acid-binding protein